MPNRAKPTMTNDQLQALCERWSQEFFGRPFRHRIVFNSRLRTTGGRYHLSDHHIDINPLMYQEFDLNTLRGVVLHELCHYHLHLMGRDYRHRSRDFQNLLRAVGGSRYAPPTSKARQGKYLYRCSGCGMTIRRQRRFNVWRYVCRRCGHHFRLISTK